MDRQIIHQETKCFDMKERKLMGKYFGTDGVRGVANSELTPELAFKIDA